MILQTSQGRREAGLTLWVIGWLSGLPCLAAPREDPAWPVMALVSLGLVAAGLHLVRTAARQGRDGPPPGGLAS